MKKLQLLFLGMILAIGFGACSSSSDDPITPEKTFKNAEVDYSFTIDDDVFEVADVKVTYTNESGEEVTETITTGTWKKELKSVNVPFSSLCTVTVTRNDKEATKDSYELGGGYSNYLLINYTDGENAALNSEESSVDFTISKENLDKVFPKTYTFNYKIVKEGDDYKGIIAAE